MLWNWPIFFSSGDNVEEAFLETARRIYEKIQNGRRVFLCSFRQFLSANWFFIKQQPGPQCCGIRCAAKVSAHQRQGRSEGWLCLLIVLFSTIFFFFLFLLTLQQKSQKIILNQKTKDNRSEGEVRCAKKERKKKKKRIFSFLAVKPTSLPPYFLLPASLSSSSSLSPPPPPPPSPQKPNFLCSIVEVLQCPWIVVKDGGCGPNWQYHCRGHW